MSDQIRAMVGRRSSPSNSCRRTVSIVVLMIASSRRAQRVVAGGGWQCDDNMGKTGCGWSKPSPQEVEIGCLPGFAEFIEQQGELSLTGPLVGERQEADHDATCDALGLCLDQPFPAVAISGSGKQLVAVDQVPE